MPPLIGTVPRTVCVPLNKSTNWTLPVAVLGETVAVKVTVCPKVDGLLFEAITVAVLVSTVKLVEPLMAPDGRRDRGCAPSRARRQPLGTARVADEQQYRYCSNSRSPRQSDC